MVFYILVPLLSFVFIFIIGGMLLSAPRYKGPVTDHFDGKVFSNPNGQKSKGLVEVLKWMWTRKQEPWTKAVDWTIPKKEFHQPKGIRITFVNHSTFLIQIGKVNILTDPVWSKRVSPFSWMGPARMSPPGVRMEDLPEIHYILLSHNHYDHLDKASLKKLHKRHNTAIYTPLGVGAYIKKIGLQHAKDLDWWETCSLRDHSGFSIQALPASHFSSRGTLDRNATLWCGFLIQSPLGNVYFAGDSGYGAFFKEIAAKTPVMDVALLPIGAYKPEWFMAPIHTSPFEAVEIHQILKPKVSIASHFGTFPLADDGPKTPLNDLEQAKAEERLPVDEFIALAAGDSYEAG